MRSILKFLLWTSGAVLAAVTLLVLIGPSIYGSMVEPDHEFGSKPLPAPPDYTQRSSWSAWPDVDSPAERLPDGMNPTPDSSRRASAFFVHPTTYGGRDNWVQPINHAKTRRETDLGTISRQASAFNACCRVYAPRYRQSNIMGYQEEEADQIFEIGYQDVRSAFLHFIETIDPNEPFVLASHSQGTFHLARLIDEEVDGTPLMSRFVAAYAIGGSLPQALVDKTYQDIEVCAGPERTGCFISWDAHEADKAPIAWSDEEESVLWNGEDYSGFTPGPRICVNPVTWRTDGEASNKQDHLGALENWSGFAEPKASIGKLYAGSVTAKCGRAGERNWLFINGDRDEAIKSQGIWSLFERNLHGSDFSLFWQNIRENAKQRVDAFLSDRTSQNYSQPNIVLILVDDLGYCDSEIYGCGNVPTPNMKQLADDGVRFTAGYVTSPVCSPSRAGLLTGRYQHRFGHEFLVEGDPTANAGLPVGEITIADALGQAGYATGMVGKWHLGIKSDHHPLNRGFDRFFGILNWGTDYIDPTNDDVYSWTHPLAKPSGNNATVLIHSDGNVSRDKDFVKEDAYLTDAFAREAAEFIEEKRRGPFFLYIPFTAIHGPLQVTSNYYAPLAHISDEARRIYAGMTSALDHGVGKILRAIRTEGLEENTIVVLLSDNGAGVADHTNNGPLRLGKHTLFEGGVRVPYIVKWPGEIEAGKEYRQPVSALDVFPTLLAAAGQGMPADRSLDGVDLLPHLHRQTNSSPHTALFWRQGPNWAVRQNEWKLIHAANQNWLYDLSQDPAERINLAERNPEVIKKLTKAFDDWNADNVDPLWPPLGGKSLPSFAVDGVAITWVL